MDKLKTAFEELEEIDDNQQNVSPPWQDDPEAVPQGPDTECDGDAKGEKAGVALEPAENEDSQAAREQPGPIRDPEGVIEKIKQPEVNVSTENERKNQPDESNDTRQEQEDDSDGESWIDKFRARRVYLLVPLAGLLMSYLLISSSITGASTETPPPTKTGAGPGGFPEIEQPEVRDEYLDIEEIDVMLLKAEKKSLRERQALRAAAMSAYRRDANSKTETKPKKEPEENQKKPSKEEQEIREKAVKAIQKSKARRRRKGRGAAKRRRPAKPATEANRVAAANQADEKKEQVPEQVKRPRKRPPRPASFYKAGVTIERQAEAQKENPGIAGFEPGTSFKASLKVGVSTDFTRAAVLAKTLEPVYGRKQQELIPEGATIKGSMLGANDRIYLEFTTAIAGDQKVQIRGYAVTGKLPGIPAIVKKGGDSPEASRAGSVLSRGALRTARGLVSTAVGGGTVAHELTRNVATEGMSEVGHDVQLNPGTTLQLPAGTTFSVVITE